MNHPTDDQDMEYCGVAVTGSAAEPDDPKPVVQIPPTMTLVAILLRPDTTPRDAANMLRSLYTAEWIADLLVALLDRIAFTDA